MKKGLANLVSLAFSVAALAFGLASFGGVLTELAAITAHGRRCATTTRMRAFFSRLRHEVSSR